MEKISWTDRVKNEEVLQRVKDERNVLRTMKEGRLAGLVTNCIPKHVIEWKKWWEDEEENVSS